MEKKIKKCLENYPGNKQATIVTGAENTIKALKKNAARIEEAAENGECEPASEEYCIVVYDTATEEVGAITGPGSIYEAPEPSDFMFVTGIIVPEISFPKSKEELLERCKKAAEIFNNECEKARWNAEKEGKKPLILVCTVGGNNYLTYSPAEKNYKIIENFKEYRVKKFSFADLNDNPDEYMVYAPTQEYIDKLSLRLELDPITWTRNMEWDAPEIMKRYEGIDIALIPAPHRKAYEEAVKIINHENSRNSVNHEAARNLESSVRRYERLIKIDAPFFIIEREKRIIEHKIRKAKM